MTPIQKTFKLLFSVLVGVAAAALYVNQHIIALNNQNNVLVEQTQSLVSLVTQAKNAEESIILKCLRMIPMLGNSILRVPNFEDFQMESETPSFISWTSWIPVVRDHWKLSSQYFSNIWTFEQILTKISEYTVALESSSFRRFLVTLNLDGESVLMEEPKDQTELLLESASLLPVVSVFVYFICFWCANKVVSAITSSPIVSFNEGTKQKTLTPTVSFDEGTKQKSATPPVSFDESTKQKTLTSTVSFGESTKQKTTTPTVSFDEGKKVRATERPADSVSKGKVTVVTPSNYDGKSQNVVKPSDSHKENSSGKSKKPKKAKKNKNKLPSCINEVENGMVEGDLKQSERCPADFVSKGKVTDDQESQNVVKPSDSSKENPSAKSKKSKHLNLNLNLNLNLIQTKKKATDGEESQNVDKPRDFLKENPSAKSKKSKQTKKNKVKLPSCVNEVEKVMVEGDSKQGTVVADDDEYVYGRKDDFIIGVKNKFDNLNIFDEEDHVFQNGQIQKKIDKVIRQNYDNKTKGKKLPNQTVKVPVKKSTGGAKKNDASKTANSLPQKVKETHTDSEWVTVGQKPKKDKTQKMQEKPQNIPEIFPQANYGGDYRQIFTKTLNVDNKHFGKIMGEKGAKIRSLNPGQEVQITLVSEANQIILEGKRKHVAVLEKKILDAIGISKTLSVDSRFFGALMGRDLLKSNEDLRVTFSQNKDTITLEGQTRAVVDAEKNILSYLKGADHVLSGVRTTFFHFD